MAIAREDSIDRLNREWLTSVPGVSLGEFPIFARIMRAGRLYRLALARVAEKRGMSYRDVYLLMSLRRAGRAVTPTELIDELSITMAAIAKRLDRLEATGFVKRRRDPDDGRSVLITLTDAGRRLIDNDIRVKRQPEFLVAGAEFDEAESAQLTALLRRLLVRLEDVAAQQ